MTPRKWNFKRDREELQELKKQRGDSYYTSGWRLWDEWFGGFQKGTLQLICAPTGGGKTTVLIALAKKAERLGYKVLYIGVEQDPLAIDDFLSNADIDFVWKNECTLQECIGDDSYDLVIYDYLGAESGANTSAQEWQVFRDQANYLSNFAIANNICILTAAQADHKIKDKNLTIEDIPNSPAFVSFSKHIVDKISAGIYIIPQGTETHAVMMKNRYKPMVTEPKQILINYQSKEVL